MNQLILFPEEIIKNQIELKIKTRPVKPNASETNPHT